MIQIHDGWHDEDEDQEDEADDLDECPRCGGWIASDSERCPRCGNYLSRVERTTTGRPIWVKVGALVSLALVLYWIFHF